MPFIPLSNIQNSLSAKQIMIICYGNAIAFFDFLIYLVMADTLSAAFFPVNDDPILTKLQALSLFTAGYLTRPIGALLIGRYADIRGRKPALLISLSCLAATTLMIACLPTYAQFGVAAPILFVIARLIQGAAFGAHAPLGWVYIAEYVPIRTLATYISFATASFMLGLMGANLIYEAINSTHTHAELIESGWRIPFVWGAMFSFIALMFWHVLEETPSFLSHQHYKKRKYVPSLAGMKVSCKRYNSIFLALLLTLVISSLTLVVALLLPDFILMRFSVDESMLSFSHYLGLLFLMLGCVFFGLLADKSGTGKALMVGSILLALQSFAFFHYLEGYNGMFILPLYAMLGFCTGIVSLSVVIIVQLFPVESRVTAFSLTYNVMYAIVGVTLPFALSYATNIVSLSPALFIIFISMICFNIGLYIYRLPKSRVIDSNLKL